MTRLYILDRAGARLPEVLAERLPPWRRARFDRLRNEKSRQESLAAGLLYACALRRAGLDPAEPVMLLPAGKPVFENRNDAFFSLSHSGRYILCAVSDHPVGADVQQARPVKHTILRRFHPNEQAWFEAQPPAERQASLFRLWTRKEAWVKAVSADRVLTLDEEDVTRDPPGLTFRDYVLPESYFAALCTGAGEPPAEPVFVTVSELETDL